jgi:hypothetical protein
MTEDSASQHEVPMVNSDVAIDKSAGLDKASWFDHARNAVLAGLHLIPVVGVHCPHWSKVIYPRERKNDSLPL